MIKIAPSILSADFGKLNEEIAEVEKYSDLLHIDVMDGHFVPNITIGPDIVKSIKTKLPIDVHLMISDPAKYAPEFAKHCDMISFHAELFENAALLKHTFKKIKSLGVKVGLALNPDKNISLILPLLDQADYILIMSVYAGFPGQKFIPEVLEKIKDLRNKYKKDIEIDGGINLATVGKAVSAGANIIVVGSAIFGAADRKKAIITLREEIK
jgi:ribulose-phosphate 3-epimerase